MSSFRAILSNNSTSSQHIILLNETSGVLSESIAQLAVSNTQWNILQKINIKPFFLEDEEAYKAWQIVNNTCNLMSGMCELSQEALRQLNENSAATADLVNLIQEHNTASTKRRKRAVLPFVGRLSRILFGILDEDNLSEIENIVETSTNETEKLANLLAQTEIVETQLRTNNEKLVEFNNSLAEIKKEIQDKKRRISL